jgi:predicted dinucleotide-binding enzyme
MAEGCPGSLAGSIREAAEFGDVVVIATTWSATLPLLSQIGPDVFRDKVVIDCTNPLRDDDFTEPCDLEGAPSGAELIARGLPGAKVVKAFNTVSTAVMQGPKFGEEACCLLFCGDDAEAKKTAGTLIADVGFEPVDVSDLVEARRLEPMALLIIRLAFRQGLGPRLGWKLLRNS